MKKIRFFIIVIWACFLGSVGFAFGEGETDTLRCKFYFPVGSVQLDLGYKENRQHLRELLAEIQAREEFSKLNRVVITTGASPEGNTAMNKELSDQRSNEIKRLIQENLGLSDSRILTMSLGEDWDGLAELIENAADMPARHEALDIIRNTPVWVVKNGKVVDGRKKRLKELRGGAAWKYMQKNLFPELRNGSMISCEFDQLSREEEEAIQRRKAELAQMTDEEARASRRREAERLEEAKRREAERLEAEKRREAERLEEERRLEAARIAEEERLEREKAEAARRAEMERQEEARRRAEEEKNKKNVKKETTTKAATNVAADEDSFNGGLKTNLLYDALLVPNVGMEFYLGDEWTLNANLMYAWWKNDHKKIYWRVYGGDLGVRKYFGSGSKARLLTGHHIGMYGQLFTYDVELGGKGYLGGESGKTIWDRMNYIVALEYGYSIPIASRLNLDFSIGAGFWGGEYYKYVPQDDHYVWQATRQRHWFGPTKAEVSLVWLLGGNHAGSVKKGDKK